MSAWIVAIVVIAVVLATVLFTWFVGGRIEKTGAAIFAVNVTAMFLFQVVIGVQAPLVTLVFDLLTAVAFGALALHAPDKLWPGVAGVGQTLVVTFSATRMLDYPLSPFAYAMAANLSGICVEVALVSGACMDRWGRRGDAEPQLQPG